MRPSPGLSPVLGRGSPGPVPSAQSRSRASVCQCPEEPSTPTPGSHRPRHARDQPLACSRLEKPHNVLDHLAHVPTLPSEAEVAAAPSPGGGPQLRLSSAEWALSLSVSVTLLWPRRCRWETGREAEPCSRGSRWQRPGRFPGVGRREGGRGPGVAGPGVSSPPASALVEEGCLGPQGMCVPPAPRPWSCWWKRL